MDNCISGDHAKTRCDESMCMTKTDCAHLTLTLIYVSILQQKRPLGALSSGELQPIFLST